MQQTKCYLCVHCEQMYISLHFRPEMEPGPTVGEGLDSTEAVQNFAATLVPLLLEVWVEASAGDNPWNNGEGSHLLSPDTRSVMFQVLTILQLLRKLAPQQGHRDSLVRWKASKFCKCFILFFLWRALKLIRPCLSAGCVVSQRILE